MKALGILVAMGALGSVFFMACADDRTSFDGGPGPFNTEAGTPDAPVCGVQCSRDLRSVIQTCDGTKVKECGPGQGCGNGECIEACDATKLSQGSIGCSFWTLPPDALYNETAGNCHAVFVTNAWPEPVALEVELGTEKLDISKSVYKVSQGTAGLPVHTLLTGPVPPGEVAVVFLSSRKRTGADVNFAECPRDVVPAIAADPLPHGTGLAKAFHLKTTLPVSAYSIYPYGGALSFAPSATLLLPEPSWAKNYVVVTAWPQADGYLGYYSRPFFQVVATEDDTEVFLRPTVDIADQLGDGGITGGVAGASKSYKLSRGQVLQLSQQRDLLGSPLESTKPVALFGGSTMLCVPGKWKSCDLSQQQIPPISQWGRKYAAVPYRSRLKPLIGSTERPPESIPYRVAGAVADTRLTYRPYRPLGAPETIGAGEVVTFESTAIFTVASQDVDHPIYMASYMTGWEFVDPFSAEGDPEFVNVVPAEQYLDDYRFFVDFTYPESSLTLVRRRDQTGFHDVTLDCKGVITEWKPIEGDEDFQYAQIEMTKSSAPVGTCSYGAQHAKSEGPFTIVVWGWAEAASYAYPAGTGSRPLSSVKITVN